MINEALSLAIKLKTSISYKTSSQVKEEVIDLIDLLKEIEAENHNEEFKNYRVDDQGNVWNVDFDIILANALHKSGYYRVRLFQDGKKYSKFVHRLVAKKYIPNPENKPEVNHIDSDRLNNKASNLEWVTASENSKHAFEHGGREPMRGTLHISSKLTEEDVLEMREIYANTKTSYAELGKKFGVSSATCGRVIIGKSYANVRSRT